MKKADLLNRYTVKKFSREQRVAAEDIDLLIDTFHLAPSSLNVQAWKLIVVESEEMKEKLAKAGMDGNVHRIKNASHVFVFARKRWIGIRHFVEVIKQTRLLQLGRDAMGVKTWTLGFMLWGYFVLHGGRFWVKQQLYIPFGMMLAVCAEKGIGSSPMEGIKLRKADRILGLRPAYATVAVLAVGYPHEDDKTNPSLLHKDRFPKEEVVSRV